MSITMQIGELARRAQCPVETIRFYEREALLPAPNRSAGNYRQYDGEHLDRLMFIRYCRSLDMTLDEIRTLLAFRDAPDQNCGQVNALLDEHIGHVAARIAELQGLALQLEGLRRLCRQAEAAKDCGILKELESEAGIAPAAVATAAEANASNPPQSRAHTHNSHIRGTHGQSSSVSKKK